VDGLPKHLPADEGEKDEGDPVVDGGDEPQELGSERPADQRHETLEAAEEERQDEGHLPVDPPHPEALADGHREGVHGETHRDEEELDKAHVVPFQHKKRGPWQGPSPGPAPSLAD